MFFLIGGEDGEVKTVSETLKELKKDIDPELFKQIDNKEVKDIMEW